MISRKTLLVGSAAGAGIAVGDLLGIHSNLDTKSDSLLIGSKVINPHGEHQPGIELHQQAVSKFIAFDLLPNIGKPEIRKWLGIISNDIEQLTRGLAVLADPASEFDGKPASLTITVGFGPGLFQKLNIESPIGFSRLPLFSIDALTGEYDDGEILIHVASDDRLSLFHATRTLIRDTQNFAKVKWVQEGFTNSSGVTSPTKRQRNLMGQIDGTDNPELNSEFFAKQVWISNGPEWAVGGTQMVLRRIKMNLDAWDRLATKDKENVIGRNLTNGAPLTGKHETDIPDLSAKGPDGFEVISPVAHIRKAAGTPEQQFFRRPFNYESEDGEAGLLWIAYCANLTKQYLPVQQKLAEGDLLNLWTTPVGSAVFFIPRGFSSGETLAEDIFA